MSGKFVDQARRSSCLESDAPRSLLPTACTNLISLAESPPGFGTRLVSLWLLARWLCRLSRVDYGTRVKQRASYCIAN
jgi:hypothetical protein